MGYILKQFDIPLLRFSVVENTATPQLRIEWILTNPAWTNAVSREIQSHSTDAQSYVEGNDDLFYSVEGIGSGVWGLRNYQPDQEEQWWPTEDEYSPGLTTEDWLALLNDACT